jgi:hypothetical protein
MIGAGLSSHAVAVLILGLVFLVAGVLLFVFRLRFDDFNMRTTPKWLKPRGGGGVYAPDQKPFRVRGNAIGGSILTVMGVVLVVLALVLRHLN